MSGDDVLVLTAEEVRLRDARVIRGTVVGGRVRARTAHGELTVEADDLLVFWAVEEPRPSSRG